MNNTNWLSDETFNLLIDYYPEVPVRPYGSGATRKNHLELLRPLDLGYVCIYAKGHSGRTTYKSSLDTVHPNLAQDMPAFYREICDELGIKLILYYSGLVDGIAALRHPDWTMRDWDGNTNVDLDPSKKNLGAAHNQIVTTFMMYPLCPLSDYFDEWVSIQLREMLAYNPDGIWIDGDWPGPCYCHRCDKRFREETGYSGARLPIHTDDTKEGRAYRNFFVKLTREWRARLRNYIHGLNPDCLYSSGNIDTNCASTPSLDWHSGDFFSPRMPRYTQSAGMRRYTNQGIPYDAYTVDTALLHERPHRRSRTKTLDRMLQEGAGVLANGGMWGYWTYPMPHGALIPSRMKHAAIAREFTREREAICKGTTPTNWTAVLEVDLQHTIGNSYVWGATKALTEAHRSPQIIDDTQVSIDMPFELLVVPNQNSLEDFDDAFIGKLSDWVEGGGILISTGKSARHPKMQELLGIKLEKEGVLDEGHIIFDDGPPVDVDGNWDRILPTTAEAWYPLYRSWDDKNIDMRTFSRNYPMDGVMDEENPEDAGFPAATLRKVGKGAAVHIGSSILENGEAPLRRWVLQILDKLQPDKWFSCDAPSWVEIALREKNGDLLIHFVNGNTGRDLAHAGTDDLTVDEIPTIGPLTCKVRCAHEPKAVTIEP
ncbi:MAG: alpha-amylase family protein, partial [Abditibacteriaceae bacterium]